MPTPPIPKPEQARKHWEDRPKCINHAGSICTAGSLKRGERLCWICDPVWQEERDKKLREDTKAKKRAKRRGVMPESISAAYEEAIVDERLVELREDLAVIEALSKDTLRRLKEDERDSSGFISILSKTLDKNLIAVKKQQMTLHDALRSIKDMLDGKVARGVAWAEYYKLVDIKRKLVDSETKRLTELGWSPELVIKTVLEITNILKKNVSQKELAVVMQKFADSDVINGREFNFLPVIDETERMPDNMKLLDSLVREKNITPADERIQRLTDGIKK